ncbi:MAG TPA: hypothetical protein VFJ97_06165 [Dermatophilaceae bacterium]|nr:hypothetical protein [Dermatophilaceae bacterium]
MPGSSPSAHAALADRLQLCGREAFDASTDLLDHYADTGDRATDAALNDVAEQAADTCRALADLLGEAASAATPTATGRAPGHSPPVAMPHGPADPPRRPRSRAEDGFGSAR